VSLVLDLLPCGHIDATHGHSHEIIRVTDFFDGPELYEKICALPMVPVPPRFMTYLGGPNDDGNPSYGNTQTDAYGAQVMVTTMGYLKKIKLTGAAGAYVQASPNSQKVALHWG
jgi:hypothetical protein